MKNSIDRNVKRKNSFRELLKTNNKNVNFPIFSWLEFSLSGLCNRVCVFCPRSNPKDFPNLNKHMPIEHYQSVIEDLKKINYRGGIIYSGFSEPILYKHIFDVIKITNKLLPNNRIELDYSYFLLHTIVSILTSLFSLTTSLSSVVCFLMFINFYLLCP